MWLSAGENLRNKRRASACPSLETPQQAIHSMLPPLAQTNFLEKLHIITSPVISSI
jgi:hypothetical protein